MTIRPRRVHHTRFLRRLEPQSTRLALFWTLLLFVFTTQQIASLTWRTIPWKRISPPRFTTLYTEGRRRKSAAERHFNKSPLLSTPSFDGWEAGDVDADLDRLEKGILKSRAQDDLSRTVRLECLDYMAQQRKPLSNLSRRVVAMSTWTLLWWWTLRQPNRFMRMFSRGLATAFSLHFWVGLVWLPTALLWLLSQKGGQDDDTANTDASPSRRTFFIPVWHDPFDFSSHQVARHVVEHWFACVAGTMFFYPFVPLPVRHFARLLVRQAVPMSWRINDKMWFLLQRPGQARPLTRSTQLLQSVTRNLLHTPLAVSWELALLFHAMHMSGTVLSGMYTLAVALALAVRWQPHPMNTRTNTTRKVLHRIHIKRWLVSGVGVYALQWTWFHRENLGALYTTLCTNHPNSIAQITWTPYLIPVLRAIAMGMACVAPFAYLLTRLGQWRLFYSHDAALTADSDLFLQRANDETGTNIWRYRYDWFEKPQRVVEILRQLRKKLWYNLFLSGSVEEKLQNDLSKKYEGVARERGQHLLDRVRKDLQEKPEAYVLDRSKWKQRAIDNMTRIHEQNWAKKNMEDPVGLALYLQYEIGLGFSFDQCGDFYEENELNNRRLQARAAKSALKRAKELYSPETATKILGNIVDPLQRERKKKELRENAEKEINRIAQRLTDLVPTGMDIEAPISEFSGPVFKRVSDNEYVVDGSIESLSMDRLHERFSRKLASPPPQRPADGLTYETLEVGTESAQELGDEATKESGEDKSENRDKNWEEESHSSPGLTFEMESIDPDELTQERTLKQHYDRDDEFIEVFERKGLFGPCNSVDDDDDTALC
eukprot:scaffold703_cov168-Amphora_coffeaeformis.AAC.25